MSSSERAMAIRSELEASLLKASVVATFVIAALGMLFGLISGSLAILFDGMFSLIDAAITWLMLIVARLVAKESNQKFQYGYWHLEPLVVALKASVLLILIIFGFLGAVQGLLAGGYTPALAPAIKYAVAVCFICLVTWFWMWRQNRRIGSALVAIDVKAWAVSGIITTALLIAFLAALAMQGTEFAHLIPYVDPAILALLSLVILPVPWADARRAFADIFGMVPADIDQHVRAVMAEFVARHGFLGFESYVTKAGRASFIEISVLARPDHPAKSIPQFDLLRREIGEAIGGAGPDRWLTIMFTADPRDL